MTGLLIHLKLNGISYLPTRELTSIEIETLEDYPLVYLTPDTDAWDPHCTSCAYDEDAMIDVEGSIVHHDNCISNIEVQYSCLANMTLYWRSGYIALL